MLADDFIKPLFWLVFKDKQIYIGVVDIEENSWVKVLRCVCKKIIIVQFSLFSSFFIYCGLSNYEQYWAAGQKKVL